MRVGVLASYQRRRSGFDSPRRFPTRGVGELDNLSAAAEAQVRRGDLGRAGGSREGRPGAKPLRGASSSTSTASRP